MEYVTFEALEAIENKEDAAKDAWRTAKAVADLARTKFGEQMLSDMGIVLGETVCTAPKWGFSSHDNERVVVYSVNSQGNPICTPVTKSNDPHAGKKTFVCDAGKLKIENALEGK